MGAATAEAPSRYGPDEMAAVDENRRSWLLEKLRGPDVGAPEESVSLAARCCDFYVEQQLFDGDHALPLDTDCPAAGDCWAGVSAEARPPRDEAPISVPWIGPRYAAGGTAAVAINFDAYGGLGGQWWVRRGANDRLRAGKRSGFDYRAGSYLAAVEAAANGGRLVEEPDPSAVAEAWEATAFMEAIKCSPYRDVSTPTDAMWRNCAPRYLVAELALLEPGRVLAIGRHVGDLLAGLLDVQTQEQASGYWRGSGTLAGKTIDVICCNHPSYGHWRQSMPSLVASLQAAPLGGG